MDLFLAALAAASSLFSFEAASSSHDPAVALRVCSTVLRQVEVDFRGDGHPVLVQRRACPRGATETGTIGELLVAEGWPQPVLLVSDEGDLLVRLTPVRTGPGQALLVEQSIGSVAVFTVLAFQAGRILPLRPPDLSGALKGEEDLDGDDLRIDRELIVATLQVLDRPRNDYGARVVSQLVVKLRPDPAAGLLRLVSSRRIRPRQTRR